MQSQTDLGSTIFPRQKGGIFSQEWFSKFKRGHSINKPFETNTDLPDTVFFMTTVIVASHSVGSAINWPDTILTVETTRTHYFPNACVRLNKRNNCISPEIQMFGTVVQRPGQSRLSARNLLPITVEDAISHLPFLLSLTFSTSE